MVSQWISNVRRDYCKTNVLVSPNWDQWDSIDFPWIQLTSSTVTSWEDLTQICHSNTGAADCFIFFFDNSDSRLIQICYITPFAQCISSHGPMSHCLPAWLHDPQHDHMATQHDYMASQHDHMPPPPPPPTWSYNLPSYSSPPSCPVFIFHNMDLHLVQTTVFTVTVIPDGAETQMIHAGRHLYQKPVSDASRLHHVSYCVCEAVDFAPISYCSKVHDLHALSYTFLVKHHTCSYTTIHLEQCRSMLINVRMYLFLLLY